MTTVATLAGLAPLAAGIGAGASLQRPLAVAVIGGLLMSTLVTLVILPGLAALTRHRGAAPPGGESVAHAEVHDVGAAALAGAVGGDIEADRG